MQLDRVTITGFDDSVHPEEVMTLLRDFPRFECALLFSYDRQGTPRYPSWDWLRRLVEMIIANKTQRHRFSAHLCGRYARELIWHGDSSFFHEFHTKIDASFYRLFHRLQLNQFSKYQKEGLGFINYLRRIQDGFHVVLPINDAASDALVRLLIALGNMPIDAFSDASEGKGLVPVYWPAPVTGVYNGWAGAITPSTVVDTVKLLNGKHQISDEHLRFWIDTESGVRTSDNRLDMNAVISMLELTKQL